MKNISDILKSKQVQKDPRNKYEFQAYGNRLAEELSDIKHRALYIKLAKNESRAVLEQAREFALASDKSKDRGRLFMWKLTQIKTQPKSD